MTTRRQWLNSWQSVVQNRNSRPIIELHMGDSITEGMGATDVSVSWTPMQQREYENTWPVSGVGSYSFEYVAAHYNFGTTASEKTKGMNNAPMYRNASGADIRETVYTATRGEGYSKLYGLLLKTVKATAGMSFEVTRVATSMDVRIYHQSANTAYSIYVNDVLYVNVANKSGMVVTPVTGLGGVSKRVKVVFTNIGTLPARIDGVAVYRGTENKGFQVWPAAYSGSSTEKFVEKKSWAESITFTPDLVTISWLTNDINKSNGNLTAQEYYTNTKALIQYLQNVKFKNSPNILYLIQTPQVWVSTYKFVEPWANYLAKQQQIADELSNILVESMSNYVQSTVNNTQDGIHPKDSNYAKYAEVTRQTINGQLPKDAGTSTADTTVPTVPTNFKVANPTTSTVALTWSASTDAGNNLKGYEILNSTTGATIRTDSLATNRTVTGLSAGKSYSFRLAAYDAENNKSAYTATISVTTTSQADTTDPVGPTTLTATVASSTAINLAWNAATDNIGVTGYRIYRTAPTTALLTTTAANTLNYAVTGLTGSTAYTFKVAPIDAADNEGNGISRSATTSAVADTTAPTTPTGLNATAISETGFTLSWTASTDSGSGIAGYNVYQNGVLKNGSTIIGTSYAVTGLEAGTRYPFVVRAYDKATNYSTSAVYYVTTTAAAPEAPTAPSGIHLDSATETSIGFSWTAPSDPGDGIAGYRIYRWTTGTPTAIGTTTNLNYVSTGLAANTAYNFVVKAFSPTNQESAGTAVLVARTSPAPVATPAAPTGLSIDDQTVTATAMTLTWSAVSGADGYLLYATHLASPLDVTATTYAFTGLSSGTNYGFVVKAYAGSSENASAGSAMLQKQTLQPADTTRPTVPAGVTSSAVTETSLTLSWNPSTDNIGVTGYKVFTNYSSIPLDAAVSATPSLAITGLSPATSYGFVVKAVDAAGNVSLGSGLHSVTTEQPDDTTAPTTPTGVATANATQTALTLTWVASTDNVGVSRYTIYRDGVQIDEVASTQTSYTVVNLKPAQTYAFVVFAHDASGNRSAGSGAAYGTTLSANDTINPTAPTNLAASNTTPTTTVLTWTASIDNVGVTQYRIYRNGLPTPIATVAASQSPTYTVTGLTANASYDFVVHAFDAAGNQSNGASVRVQTPTGADSIPPGVPRDFAFTSATLNTITFSWSAPADNVGVAKYRVYQNGVQVALVNAPTTSYTAEDLDSGRQYAFVISAIDGSDNESANTQAFYASTKNEEDITAPTAPTNLASSGVTDTSVVLSWTPASDDTLVQEYQVFANGQQVGSIDHYTLTDDDQNPIPATITYTLTGLSPSTSYTIFVRAVDTARNVGNGSTAISIMTAQPVVISGGILKVWNGASWVQQPLKVWNGSAWIDANLKLFGGSDWQ